MTVDLPVLMAMDRIRRALGDDGACVLVAPPGTGKTTGVPPALLGEEWMVDRRIIMLEPRRLAARATAGRMAAVHGERVGGVFGYSVRGESRVSPRTRVEVVTEGLFLRRIQNDPELSGVAAVVLDEFHERSVDADLALALVDDIRSSIRPDLRVLVMSATMDAGPVSEMLSAPVVEVTAPIHPVETRYRPGSVHVPMENRVADVVVEALGADEGDLLVFLPGRPEIHRVHRLLEERLVSVLGPGGVGGAGGSAATAGLQILDLHGSLTPGQQQGVIDPHPGGPRRVVLATSIAETSLTIPGVRVVVDSGRRRTNRIQPNSGLPALVTVPVSLAGADQRRGRAGRTAPGVAYRMWSREDERHRPAHDPPEILAADLAPLLLQTYTWGVGDPSGLRWLDPPPAGGIEAAVELLSVLGALDEDGRLNATGRDFAAIGFHPRLAAMAVAGVRIGCGDLAARLCAVVETSRTGPVDLVERLDAMDDGSSSSRTGSGSSRTGSTSGSDHELRRSLRQWSDTIRTLESVSSGSGVREDGSPEDGSPEDGSREDGSRERRTNDRGTKAHGTGAVARIVLAGYPDRIARRRDTPDGRDAADGRGTPDRRGGSVVFQLRSGDEFTVPTHSAFGREEWVVAADLDHGSHRLHLGAAVPGDVVMEVLGPHVTTSETVEWDDRASTIDARRSTTLGAITISTGRIRRPAPEAVREAIHQAFERHGPAMFGSLAEADGFRARVALVRVHDPSMDWPDLSDPALVEHLIEWLGPRLDRVRGADDLARIDVRAVLGERLRWDQIRELDRLTPSEWTLATGRTVRLQYGRVDGDATSVLARVRLGDAMGTDTHPTVVGGRVPVTVELLSPAGRPVQRTTDLPGFWRGSYADVRSDLRGRYPKHPWPIDPWNVPERRSSRRDR